MKKRKTKKESTIKTKRFLWWVWSRVSESIIILQEEAAAAPRHPEAHQPHHGHPFPSPPASPLQEQEAQ